MTLTQITEKGIKDGEIINADINASAAIAKSKLAALNIANGDVSSSTSDRIDGNKITPNFGGQAISTTGYLDCANQLTIGGTEPRLVFTDGDNNPDFTLWANGGNFKIYDTTNSTSRFNVNSSGNIGIGTESQAHKLHIADATTPELIVEDTTNNVKAVVGADNSVARIGSDTNHSLTLRTNDTERVRIDTSGRLLIGHSTGNGYPQLSVSGNTSGASGAGMLFLRRGLDRATIGSNVGADLGEVDFGDLDGNIYASIQGKTDAATGSNDYPGRLVFATTADAAASPSERMRINSDGALMVGTTVSRTAEFSHPDGVSIRGDVKGQYQSTVTDSMNMLLNRDGTDGQILGFRKDGTDIGNIGVAGSNIYVQFGSSGTSAHRLDDYEEGTFTPGMTFGGGNTGMSLGSMDGKYTKIGRHVFCHLRFNMTGKGDSTGVLEFTGLPFGVSDIMATTAVQGGFPIGFLSGHNSGIHEVFVYAWEGGSVLKAYKRANENSGPTEFTHSDIVSTFDGRLTFFYMTTS